MRKQIGLRFGELAFGRRLAHAGTVNFAFDPAKSAANKAKHGLDFVTAQQIWETRTV